MAPLYIHDCDICEYRGTIDGKDIYTCNGVGVNIVVRYSDDGPDYSSSAIYGDNLTDIFQGIRLLEVSDDIFLTVGLRKVEYANI
jgi:hypothetical protein